MSNTITVQGETRVTVIEESPANITIQAPSQIAVVEVKTQGPQGASSGSLSQLSDLDIASVADGSTLIYNSSSGKWVGNDDTTVSEILNGGNY